MRIKTFLAATAAAALVSGAASSATFLYSPSVASGGNDFATDLSAFFGAGNVGFGVLEGVTAGTNETLTFQGVGAESGYTNSFEIAGTTPGSITESNESFGNGQGPISSTFTGALAAGDLKFTSSGAADALFGSARFGIYYALNGFTDTVFLAFDDQETGADDDHDDFLVQTTGSVSIAAVPLPASALLLLGGIGGLAALRRRTS